MNESEELNSAEADGLSLNATTSVCEYLPINITDSSEIFYGSASLIDDNVANGFDDEHDIDDDEFNINAHIEPVDKSVKSASGNGIVSREVNNLYEELVVLNEYKLIENQDAFKCEFCLNACEPKAGVILTGCIHSFCKTCITRIVQTTNDVEIKCPYRDEEYVCEMIMPHHKVKEIVGPKIFDIFIQRSITLATGRAPFDSDYSINGGDGEASGSLYKNLVALNDNNLVENEESFTCIACHTECKPKAGVILTECIHSICKECIKRIVETTDDVEIKCPFRDWEYACDTIIPQRKIKEICGVQAFEKFLERSLSVACSLEDNPTPIGNIKEKKNVDTAYVSEYVPLNITGSSAIFNGTASLIDDNVANGFDENNIDDDESNINAHIELVGKGRKSASGDIVPREVHNLYEELVVLNEYKLVENQDSFKCEFCLNVCEPKAGVILTECIHSICKACITRIVQTTNDVEIKCPYRDAEYICKMIMPHHEIKEIISPKDFDIFIQRSITVATGGVPLHNDYPIHGGDGEASGSLYKNLVALNDNILVENLESFICIACHTECKPKAGVILTECIHSICKECIKRIVELTDDVEIKCPFRDWEYACDTIIPQCKIKEICGVQSFEKFLEKSLSVACSLEENPTPIGKVKDEKQVVDTALYAELVVLDDDLLVENQKAFNCEVCLNECEPNAGIIIAECLHEFCKQCIATLVETTTDVEIHCPYRDNEYSCEKIIQHREIKQVVSQEVFDKFLEKSISIAIRGVRDARNCQSPDCKGWICINGNDTFTCPICKKINCVLCKGLHDPKIINCEQYKRTLINPNQPSEDLLRSMVSKQEAMICPSCGVVIQKVDGCDGVKCTRCNTDICWATKGPRWGPRGKGDNSGGCRCNLNGQRCHPNCRNCH